MENYFTSVKVIRVKDENDEYKSVTVYDFLTNASKYAHAFPLPKNVNEFYKTSRDTTGYTANRFLFCVLKDICNTLDYEFDEIFDEEKNVKSSVIDEYLEKYKEIYDVDNFGFFKDEAKEIKAWEENIRTGTKLSGYDKYTYDKEDSAKGKTKNLHTINTFLRSNNCFLSESGRPSLDSYTASDEDIKKHKKALNESRKITLEEWFYILLDSYSLSRANGCAWPSGPLASVNSLCVRVGKNFYETALLNFDYEENAKYELPAWRAKNSAEWFTNINKMSAISASFIPKKAFGGIEIEDNRIKTVYSSTFLSLPKRNKEELEKMSNAEQAAIDIIGKSSYLGKSYSTESSMLSEDYRKIVNLRHVLQKENEAYSKADRSEVSSFSKPCSSYIFYYTNQSWNKQSTGEFLYNVDLKYVSHENKVIYEAVLETMQIIIDNTFKLLKSAIKNSDQKNKASAWSYFELAKMSHDFWDLMLDIFEVECLSSSDIEEIKAILKRELTIFLVGTYISPNVDRHAKYEFLNSMLYNYRPITDEDYKYLLNTYDSNHCKYKHDDNVIYYYAFKFLDDAILRAKDKEAREEKESILSKHSA